MYELSVQREFCAAHALSIAQQREPTHGHNWTVTAIVSGDELDDDGLLFDFHVIEKHLDNILAPFHNSNLNEQSPFDRINPSAEHVARFIAEQLQTRLSEAVRVAAVRVTEAPGCEATYRPG